MQVLSQGGCMAHSKLDKHTSMHIDLLHDAMLDDPAALHCYMHSLLHIWNAARLSVSFTPDLASGLSVPVVYTHGSVADYGNQ